MILEGICWAVGTREEQQDFFGFSDPNDADFIKHGGRLSIVCDGMGGLENGQEASHCAVETFLEAYRKKSPNESIPDALYRSVNFANKRVLEMAESFGQVENCGSTLVAAVVHNDSLYWISVGDSHVYLCRNKELCLLNEEHVYANKLQAAVKRGLLYQEEADFHPDREALTSYIGIPELNEISSGTEEREIIDGAGVMLCSDGLSKVLSMEEMSAVFDIDPNQWAINLVEATLSKKRTHQDNVTVTILRRERSQQQVKKVNKKKLKINKLFIVLMIALVFGFCYILILSSGSLTDTTFESITPLASNDLADSVSESLTSIVSDDLNGLNSVISPASDDSFDPSHENGTQR